MTAPGSTDRPGGGNLDFRLLAESLPHIVWFSRGDGSDLYLNAHGLTLTGHEQPPDRWDLLVHPDDRPRVMDVWSRAARAEEPFEFEYRLRLADGSHRWHRARGLPLRDSEGAVEWWIGAATDIHDLKETEFALRRAEERAAASAALIEATQEAAPVAFGVVDREFRVVRVNSVMAAFSPLEPEEQIGRPLAEVLGDFWPRIAPHYHRVLETGEALSPREIAGPGDPADPATPVWLASYYPIHVDGELIGIGVVSIEISGRLRAERETAELQRELEHARRMETVGHMAGALAHDFNNLLSIVLNYAEFALEALGDHPASDDIRQVGEAARQAAELTGKLLVLSRHARFSTERVDLGELLRSIEPLLAGALTERSALELAVDDELWPVEADCERLEQLLINLTLNARDAMPEGGTVRIDAENLELDEAAARLRANVDAGRYVHISVSDDGTGMPAEVVEHAFDPFFTTKPLGKGTGLGLATVYSVVTEAGGHVSIESTPGAGTTVHVTWPAADGGTVPASAEAAPAVAAPAEVASTTVLVVDDEPAIRRLAGRILRSVGYDVVEATSGEEALAADARPDILLTDVVMPGLSGPELAAALRARDGVAKVAYMSGHSPDPHALEPDAPFLAKPFTREDVLRALDELRRR